MAETPTRKRTAWQPLTFSGAADFAGAVLRRLLSVQLVFAVLVAATVCWFLHASWFPTIRAAIGGLPATGEIRNGRLAWRDETPRLLAEGRFVSFAVDVNHTGVIRSPAHVQVELGREAMRFISLFGYADCPYPPRGWLIALNRTEVEPWWGAWSPPILWITFASVITGLFASWALLATLYCFPVWLLGFFANRDLNLSGSWKIAGAALMPGALFMMIAILFYGFGLLDLMQLIAAAVAHLAVGLVYVIGAPFWAPPLPSSIVRQGNPFTAADGSVEKDRENR